MCEIFIGHYNWIVKDFFVWRNMKEDSMQITCVVLLVELVQSGKFVEWFTPSRFECLDEIVFRESTTNDFISIVNHILDAIVHIEKYSTLENNSLVVHDEILVAIEWELVSEVNVIDSARATCTGYSKDVSVLFERDSEDETVKSGEVSVDSVKLNESKAISFIGYKKCGDVAEEVSIDNWIEIKSNWSQILEQNVESKVSEQLFTNSQSEKRILTCVRHRCKNCVEQF